ncbi:GRIP and coiled-coil domain-containing protein-like [Colias croceus]|uniref:GRIP and coiled-coil domain-containing protein-like n=1 Tax=Colias crocea TaxID=72248 RepID=UPI001E27BFB2|nr:GRIP and coiled-coil domain-containing protein-like [Colias croceus]
MDSSVFIAQTKMFPIDNYLPLTFKRNYSRTVPVYMSSWDTCDEFFEFEVKNTLDPNNNDFHFEMKTCHICNIDVPKLFIKEHCQSKKHLMFKTIANTALKRMRNHMNDVDESTPDYIPNVYFCSTCVAVVKISDKDYHTRQQSHKNSLIADKLLNNFLSLYTHYNDDNDKDNLDSAEDLNVQDDSNTTVKLDTSNNTDLSLLVPNDVTDNESNNITTNKKQILDSIRKELHTIDEIVMKGINRKQSSNLKQQAKSDNIWNKTESNNVPNEAKMHMVKPIDNLKYDENKYSQLKDNKIQDSKENMIDANKPGNRSKAISKVQEINEENDSDETNEELTLINKEETQKNKDELKTDDTERNNLQSSETKDLKIKDEKHSRNRDTNKITNTQQLPDLNTSSNSFKIGNTIAKDLFESHNNALKDLNAHKIKIISENYMEIQCTDGAKVCVCSDNYFCVGVESDDNIYCEICTETFVPVKQLEHIKKKHMHDLNAPLENEHCIRNLGENIYHCVLCNDISDDLNRHINTKYHERHLEKALIKKGNTNTEIEIKDEPWDVIFYDELDSPATEISEVDDDENVIDNIKISSERISLQEDNKYYCDICKTDIHVNDIKLHLNSSRHKMNKISNVHYMMKDMDVNLLCKVCQELIHNERTSITYHVNKLSHKNAYNKLLYENWIEKFYGQLHCRVCMEYIQEKNELLHIYTKKHIKMKNENELNDQEDKEMPYYCDICEIYLPKSQFNIKEHENDESHKTKAKLVSKDTDLMPTNTRPNKANNIETRTGIEKYNKNDTEEKPVSYYYCLICKVKIPNRLHNVREHNNGRSHLKMLESKKISLSNDKNPYYCQQCNVKVGNNPKNIDEHIKGAKHRSNVEIKGETARTQTIINQNDKTHLDTYKSVLLRDKMNDKNAKNNNSGFVKTPESIEAMETIDTKIQALDEIFDRIQNELLSYNAIEDPNTAGQSIKVEEIPFLKDTGNPNELLCAICEKKVPNTEYNITTHIRGAKHGNNHQKFSILVEQWQELRSKMTRPDMIYEAFTELLQLLEEI